MRKLVVFGVFLAVFLVSVRAEANQWIGGYSNNWSDGGNWSMGMAPYQGESLEFDYRAWSSYNNMGTYDIGSITMSGSAQISGGPLNLSYGITSTSGYNYVNMELTLTGDQSFDVSSGSTLYTSNINLQWSKLTIQGQGDTNVSYLIYSYQGGSLTKSGSGTLTLGCSNYYSGGTTINEGSVMLTVNGALGSGAVNVSGGVLDMCATSSTVGAVSLASGTITGTTGVLTGSSYSVESGEISAILGGTGALTKTTAGTATLSKANTYTGATTVSEGTLAYGASNAISNSSAVAVNGGVLNLGAYSDTVASLTLSGGSVLGSGKLTASAYNIYEGTITVDLGASGTLTKYGDGIFNFTGEYLGTTVNEGTLSFSTDQIKGDVTNNGTLAFDQAGDGVYAGVISGTGYLTKAGAGSLTLSGTNTYSGETLVNVGELIVNGSIANSTVFLEDGAILSGSGALGDVFQYDGSIWAPGNSPGTQSAMDVTWFGGATYEWEINDPDAGKGADPGWDWLNISGVLTIDADESDYIIDIISLTSGNEPGILAGFDNTQSYSSWIIATATGGITGFNADYFTLDTSGFEAYNPLNGGYFSLVQGGNDLILNFTPAGGPSDVPEASTLLLILPLLGGIGLRMMRSRRKAQK
jgi:autotransporter-associated beta strand protein